MATNPLIKKLKGAARDNKFYSWGRITAAHEFREIIMSWAINDESQTIPTWLVQALLAAEKKFGAELSAAEKAEMEEINE